jgi:hypothetical protein
MSAFAPPLKKSVDDLGRRNPGHRHPALAFALIRVGAALYIDCHSMA